MLFSHVSLTNQRENDENKNDCSVLAAIFGFRRNKGTK